MNFVSEVATFVCTLSCGTFAGAAVYVSLVEHPARMECGVEVAAREFVPSYRRAAFMQALLAALGFVSSAVAWFVDAGFWWLAGGVLLGSNIPFTLLAIMPTNKQLLDPALDRRSELAGDLLRRWSRLHAIRSLLATAAFGLFLYLLAFTRGN